MVKRSKSSKSWLREHFADSYVKRSQQDGYPSRAAYKLLEINQQHKILAPGMIVIDLGAAPGGWTMVASKLIGNQGKIIALDLLPLKLPNAPSNLTFLQGDFTQTEIITKIFQILNLQQVDLVLSDMAPNLSGIAVADQARAMELVQAAFDFACKVLKPNANFLAKVFQSNELSEFKKNLSKNFAKVEVCKPEASRKRSAEIYLLAKNRKNSV